MRERAGQWVLACVLALGAPHCGMRTRGIEIAVHVVGADGSPAADLEIGAVELLPCDDPAARMARALGELGVAHAHEAPPGATHVVLPDGARWTLRPSPGSYCGVRLAVDDVETFAGSSGAGDIVASLTAQDGAPTPLVLARTADTAEITIVLGVYGSNDTPSRALDHMADGARAIVAAP